MTDSSSLATSPPLPLPPPPLPPALSTTSSSVSPRADAMHSSTNSGNCSLPSPDASKRCSTPAACRAASSVESTRPSPSERERSSETSLSDEIAPVLASSSESNIIRRSASAVSLSASAGPFGGAPASSSDATSSLLRCLFFFFFFSFAGAPLLPPKTVIERMWLIDSTVAAHIHGSPQSDVAPVSSASTARSRW